MTEIPLRPFGRWLILFAIAYLAVLMSMIWLPGIGGSSEAREAHVVHVITTTGEWVLPTRNGIVPSKPPLYHWFAAGLSEIFGWVTPFSVRLVSALSAALLVIVTGWAGFACARASGVPLVNRAHQVGGMSAAILATTYLTVSLAGAARVDMLFALLSTCAIASFLIPLAHNPHDLFRARSRFFAICGVAVLAKGPLGFVLPLLVAGAGYTWMRGLRRALTFFLLPHRGWLWVIAIPALWYAPAIYYGGMPFVSRQILFENVNRLTGHPHMNAEPFWFYVPEFVRTMLPWSPLFLLFTVHTVRDRPSTGSRGRTGEMLLLIWVGVGLVLFSMASGKRPSYLLPLVPAVSIFVSLHLVRWFSRTEWETQYRSAVLERRVRDGAAYLMFLLLLGLELMKVSAGPADEKSYAVYLWVVTYAPWLQTMAAACCVILAMGPRGVFGTGLGVAAIMTVAFHTGTAIKAHLKGFEGMASRILAEAGDEPFAVYKERYDEYFDPILFYLRRPVPVRTPGELGSCKGLVVLRRMLLEEARKGMADRRITILREFTEEAASADDRERRKIALARCE